MPEQGTKPARFSIRYFDGINSTVQPTLSKRTELSHAENARSTQIGVIEKREGQSPYGTNANGSRFVATVNYGITKFPTQNSSQAGVFRFSVSGEPTQNLSVVVFETIIITEPYFTLSGTTSKTLAQSATNLNVKVVDAISITDSTPYSSNNHSSVTVNNSVGSTTIYALTTTNTWSALSDSDAQGIVGGQFDYTIAEQDLYIVNKNDRNRILSKDGSTVITSASAGSFYNCPNASKIAYYKSRLHIADFQRDAVDYPTTILRSSYPMGIVALVDGDHASGVTEINLTDTKYMYATSGMNSYEIYRGGTLIATVTALTVTETSITVSATGVAINSADEVWIAGTFNGPKQFRWVNNAGAIGRDVKQYDTFKLSGGESDPITLFETVGNVLMVGNRFNLATWDDYTLQMMDLNVGCTSKTGYAKLLGTLYFVHYSGAYATTGGLPTLISRKVARYFAGATKSGLENAGVGVKGLSVFFCIGDVKLYNDDGSFWKTLSNVCLEYSVADQNWYVHTNVPITEFINFISSDGGEHLLGNHTGNSNPIMEFLTGTLDDGTEIFFRVDTQELQLLQEFETYVNLTGVSTDIYRGSQLKCFASLDKGDFYELKGTIGKGISVIKFNPDGDEKQTPPMCRKVKLSYRDSSKQLCRINQLALAYSPSTIQTIPE